MWDRCCYGWDHGWGHCERDLCHGWDLLVSEEHQTCGHAIEDEECSHLGMEAFRGEKVRADRLLEGQI